MPKMPRIRLLHWKSAEAAKHIALLQSAGHEVEYEEQFRPGLLRTWRESPPDAFVIDLSRLPSQGREIAIALRQSAVTRGIPIVFCEGATEKVEKIRAELPDAAYSTVARLPATLKKALANPPVDPVKPLGMMDRYAARTAAQKLGIQEFSRVALIDPPRDYRKALGELPRNVEFLEGPENAGIILCFTHEVHSLPQTLSGIRDRASSSKLWILWRKGGSHARGEITERLVREQAIDLGLVDYKVCSVDRVWSAMLFAARR